MARDLLFRRFAGLNLSESVPDHSTIWRFRNLLQKEGLLDSMLERINTQLARASLIVTQGSLHGPGTEQMSSVTDRDEPQH